MLKPCRSIKTRNECIVTDNSKLPVTDLLRMLLYDEMGNGEGGKVYGKKQIPNLFLIERQRSPLNALLMNFKLFKTC